MITSNKKSFKHQYKQIPVKPTRLIFETLLCVSLIIPAILWSVLKLLFVQSPRKNIKGQVVLVSTINQFQVLIIFIIIAIFMNSVSFFI